MISNVLLKITLVLSVTKIEANTWKAKISPNFEASKNFPQISQINKRTVIPQKVPSKANEKKIMNEKEHFQILWNG